LELLLAHEDIKTKDIPILFFANKSDLPNAKSEQEIASNM
jgi:signal recognition particle receptor subunit beta